MLWKLTMLSMSIENSLYSHLEFPEWTWDQTSVWIGQLPQHNNFENRRIIRLQSSAIQLLADN